ncbi:WXG100 family type VII secretion target [Candidatus Mycolicibacterium alkanivorans]|uniref:ESAT-6-like protein n=1 Tax=Candidatus Mycolicibacterium alkanivorans TaxID=2954114 RepID=A0ABS9YZZ5_9MYCO|nr:WXG100 family type VII secretion target [Candidatus Mycolicibacterium alkanivorans]MCI4676805.1 WXG100 family type VII secretion target [Candidatus Mycolicibacterium alkanivorans]
MSGDLRVEPAALVGTCESLSGAAEHLLGRLKSLDGAVTSMLTGWQGCSGRAFGDAWRMWHQGADEVEKALAIMADLLGQAAKGFESHEQAGVEQLRGVCGG